MPVRSHRPANLGLLSIWCLVGACTLARSSAIAQNADQPLGPLPHISYETVNPTPWFNHPAVRQELNWNEQTHRHFVNTYGDLFSQYSDAVSQIPGNLTLSERRQRERELTRNFHAQLSTELDRSLREEAARRRYDELHLQYQGRSAFHDPAVQQKLKISQEQRELLLKESKEWDQALADYWKMHKKDPKAAKEAFEKARASLSDRLNNTLDSAQLETWKDMIGKPYEFPSDVYLMTHPENAAKKPAEKTKTP